MANTKFIYQQLNKLLADNTPVATATIVRVRGSAPREVGSKMIINPLGQHIGTIGGGCGEGNVIKTGLDVLDLAQPKLVSVDLTGDISMESTAVCGGVMDVFVEPWTADDASVALVSNLLTAFKAREAVALVSVVEAGDAHSSKLGQRAVFNSQGFVIGNLEPHLYWPQIQSAVQRALEAGRSQLFTVAEGYSLFVEIQQRPPGLIVVGAGHVAKPLAELAR